MSVVHVRTENGSLTTLYNCSTVNCIKVKISALYDKFAPDVTVLSGFKTLKDDAKAPAICSVKICDVVYNEAMWKRVLLAHAHAYDVPGMKRAIVTMKRYGQVNDAMCSQVFVQYIRDSKLAPDVNSIWAFIACGAMIDYTDGHGRTALLYASEYGHARVVKCLVITGADINLSDKSGKTPLAIAKERNHTIVENLLVSLGAKAPGAAPGKINASSPATVCAPSPPVPVGAPSPPAPVCATSPPLIARKAPSPTVCAPPLERINAPSPASAYTRPPPLVVRKAPSPPLAARNVPTVALLPKTAKRDTTQKRAESADWQVGNPCTGGNRNPANGKESIPQGRAAAENARDNPDRKSMVTPAASYAQEAPKKMEAQDQIHGDAGDSQKNTSSVAPKTRDDNVRGGRKSLEAKHTKKVKENRPRQRKSQQKRTAKDNVAKKTAKQDDLVPQQDLHKRTMKDNVAKKMAKQDDPLPRQDMQKKTTKDDVAKKMAKHDDPLPRQDLQKKTARDVVAKKMGKHDDPLPRQYLQKKTTKDDAAKKMGKHDDPLPRQDLQKKTTKDDVANKMGKRGRDTHRSGSTKPGTETSKIRHRSSVSEFRESSKSGSLWSFLVSKGPVARGDMSTPRAQTKTKNKKRSPSPKRKRGTHARRRTESTQSSSVRNGCSPKRRGASRVRKPARRHQQRR